MSANSSTYLDWKNRAGVNAPWEVYQRAIRTCSTPLLGRAKESSLCQAQQWKKEKCDVQSWKTNASKGSIVGLTPRQDWTRHFSVVPARRPGSGAQGKRNKSYSIKVPFRRYWTNQPTAGTLGLVHKVLLIILWQWESLESHGVWDRADLIMIIGLHQLQIALMEWDFSDQEHIFDCRSKFTSLSLFFRECYYAMLCLCSQRAATPRLPARGGVRF